MKYAGNLWLGCVKLLFSITTLQLRALLMFKDNNKLDASSRFHDNLHISSDKLMGQLDKWGIVQVVYQFLDVIGAHGLLFFFHFDFGHTISRAFSQQPLLGFQMLREYETMLSKCIYSIGMRHKQPRYTFQNSSSLTTFFSLLASFEYHVPATIAGILILAHSWKIIPFKRLD